MLMLRRMMFTTVVLSLHSCGGSGPKNGEGSNFAQLTNKTFQCDVLESRRPKSKLATIWSFFGGKNEHKEDVYDILSRLPTEYRYWVFDHNFLKINIREQGGSIRGVTTLSGTSRLMRPKAMWVTPRMRNGFHPLMHEIGHAVEDYVANTHTEFDSELTALYNWVVPNIEGRQMRQYAKTNRTELFAEIFDSYYCSKEAREHMREKMPRTWYFAKRFLIDPKLPESSSNTSELGRENNVDQDDDLVSNAFDQCPDTPKNSQRIFTMKKFYGCSPSQKGGGDADRDGVLDGEDLCPGTKSGLKVWKDRDGENRVYLGCGQGQTPILKP